MATSRVNVKIPTQRLIDALTESKTKHEKIITEHEAQMEKVKASTKAREDAAYAYANDPKNADKISREISNWGGKLTVRLEVKVPESALPSVVEFPRSLGHEANEARDAINAIDNSIRILNLTDDEHVSTSTYNSVARYL
jgi:hypothetical protein